MTDAKTFWCPPTVDQRIWWGHLLGKLDPSHDSSLPRPALICVRGLTLGADTTHENIARPGYPDTGILLYRGNEVLFPMSSVPYQTRSKASPDVDGDGQGDVACIKTGRYILTDKGAQPYPIFELTLPDGTKRVPCSRDLRHDGLIDHEGPAIYGAEAILAHTGIDGLKLNPPSAHTYSIGCQTMSLEWLRLLHTRAQLTGSGVIDYYPTDADVVIEIMKQCPYRPDEEITAPFNVDKGIA